MFTCKIYDKYRRARARLLPRVGDTAKIKVLRWQTAGPHPTAIYRINFKRAVIRDLRRRGSVLYCLNFISRIAQREHTCACTRCRRRSVQRRTCSAPNTRIRQLEARKGRSAGSAGRRGEKRRRESPRGNTGSRAQAVPSALVIFPFYAFHSFVSLRMPASACCCTSVCVRAG